MRMSIGGGILLTTPEGDTYYPNGDGVPDPPPFPEYPAWLRTADDITLVPAEYSVAGSVFLATLLIGVGVTRLRRSEE